MLLSSGGIHLQGPNQEDSLSPNGNEIKYPSLSAPGAEHVHGAQWQEAMGQSAGPGPGSPSSLTSPYSQALFAFPGGSSPSPVTSSSPPAAPLVSFLPWQWNNFSFTIKVNTERRSSCHLWQHRWTSRVLCYVKSARERQILLDITYTWSLKNVKLIQTEDESSFQGLGDEGNRESLDKGYKLSALR